MSVGLLPTDKGAEGAITANFPFQANGRALTMDAGDEGGFVRVVARKDDHRILGIQAVGLHVSELSGEFAHALEMGAVLEDVAGTIHAHPTLSEAFHEATLRVLGHAIHAKAQTLTRPLPEGLEARNSCPLSLRERVRVRVHVHRPRSASAPPASVRASSTMATACRCICSKPARRAIRSFYCCTGFPELSYSWRKIMPALAAAGYHVRCTRPARLWPHHRLGRGLRRRRRFVPSVQSRTRHARPGRRARRKASRLRRRSMISARQLRASAR